MAIQIKADGFIQWVKPAQGKKFKLKELQGFVNGLIEEIRLDDGYSMLVNEEFTYNGSRLNQLASDMAGQPICDDVLLIDEGEWS